MRTLEPLSLDEIDERKEEFNQWMRKEGDRLGFFLLPANRQHEVREMLKKSFYAGYNFKRRLDAPVTVGGNLW